jgi:hypothetical protein
MSHIHPNSHPYADKYAYRHPHPHEYTYKYPHEHTYKYSYTIIWHT